MISWLALHLELSLALFQVRAELEARRCMGHYWRFYRPVSRGKGKRCRSFRKLGLRVRGLGFRRGGFKA